MATGLYSLSLCSVGFICCSTSKLTLIQLLHVCTCAQLCPTLCNRIDCSLPDFSVHGIFQAGILEQVDISYPGITLASLVLAGGFFTTVPPGSLQAVAQRRLTDWHRGQNSDVSLVAPELSVATLPASTPLITHFTFTCKTLRKK